MLITNREILQKTLVKIPYGKLYNKLLSYFPHRFIKKFFNEAQKKEELLPFDSTNLRVKLENTFASLNRIDLSKHISGFCNYALRKELAPDSPSNLVVCIPLMVPSTITQIHLYILIKAMNFLRIGAKVIIVLEDTNYINLSLLGDRRWSTPLNSIRDFKKCKDKLFKVAEKYIPGIPLGNLSILKESELEIGNYFSNTQEKITSLLDATKINFKLKHKLKNLAYFRKKKSTSVYDANTLIINYLKIVKTTEPSIILTGNDRKGYYEYLSEICEEEKLIMRKPLIIRWEQIPDIQGNEKWESDSSFLLHPFNENISLSVQGTLLYKWFKKAILKSIPFKDKTNSFFTEIVTNYQSTLTLRELCKSIYEKNSKLIKAVILFGSNNDILDKKISRNEITSRSSINVEGDIDLIFIVKEKSPKVFNLIEEHLSQYGQVIFHPDFYSKRTGCEKIYEIIVLPMTSGFFVNPRLGILTGLSVFTTDRFEFIVGKELYDTRGLKLPTASIDDIEKRRSIFVYAQNGINDVIARIYPHLNSNNLPFDFIRLFRFILMDLIWTEKNIWVFEWKEIKENISDIFTEKIHIDFINNIFLKFTLEKAERLDPPLNNDIKVTKEELEQLYDILRHLKKRFSAKKVEEFI